jgi:hypothetical protein
MVPKSLKNRGIVDVFCGSVTGSCPLRRFERNKFQTTLDFHSLRLENRTTRDIHPEDVPDGP